MVPFTRVPFSVRFFLTHSHFIPQREVEFQTPSENRMASCLVMARWLSATGYGSKSNHQELDRRFWSMFPFTRAPHFGVTLFLTHLDFRLLPPVRCQVERARRLQHLMRRGKLFAPRKSEHPRGVALVGSGFSLSRGMQRVKQKLAHAFRRCFLAPHGKRGVKTNPKGVYRNPTSEGFGAFGCARLPGMSDISKDRAGGAAPANCRRSVCGQCLKCTVNLG